MKVLLIANLSPLRCGEKEYALIWADALRAQEVEVDLWNGVAPVLPPNYTSYDLLHFNWGPAQMGGWGEGAIPADAPPISIFLHDVPPNSECFLVPRAKLLMSYEEMPGSVVLDHAVPSYVPGSAPSEDISIGVTGIRGDGGFEMVEKACAANGWRLNAPLWWEERKGIDPSGKWLTSEQEIERLATSTVNVCWYHTSGRGKSMGAMFCLAARRPLIVSQSTMFSHLHPYLDEIMIVQDSHYDLEGKVGPAIELALAKLGDGWPLPSRVIEELSWRRLAARIKELWEGVAR